MEIGVRDGMEIGVRDGMEGASDGARDRVIDGDE
jgi:hypothetical protein